MIAFAFLVSSSPRAEAQGQCLALDGNGDYMSAGNAPDLTINGPTTIECWILLTSYPSTPARILSKVEQIGGVFRGFTFHMQSGYIELGFYQVGNTVGYFLPHVSIPWTAIPLGTWTHLAGVLDVSTLSLYVNGASQGTLAYPLTYAPSPSAPFLVGADLNWSNGQPQSFLPGQLDEVRYWNVARTQTEIVTSINLEFDSVPGLVACWHFNGSLADGSGGHTGTARYRP